MSRNLPGFGDASTWGAINHPNDPRRNEASEEADQDAVEFAVETVEYHLANIRRHLAVGALTEARKEFEKIAEVSL